MPFDLTFLLVGFFAAVLLVGLLLMLGRGGVWKASAKVEAPQVRGPLPGGRAVHHQGG